MRSRSTRSLHTPRAAGEDPNPCRGIADTSPLLAGPGFQP
jgi:hypothetical protein